MQQGDLVVKKATEYGAVEIWMNERVRRACSSSCATFLYGFLEVFLFVIFQIYQRIPLFIFFCFFILQKSSKDKGDEYWLIWDYEGEKTLSDLMASKEFPYNVSTQLRISFFV